MYFWGKYPDSTHRLGQIQHQCTVILIELLCIFFSPEILDIQGLSAAAGITEPVLELFPGRAFSVYSVFHEGSRCNFDRRATDNNVPVVTLTESPGNNYFRCNFVFPVDTSSIFITAMIPCFLFHFSIIGTKLRNTTLLSGIVVLV